MPKITPAGDAARQFLIDHPDFRPARGGKPVYELSDEYAGRMASGGQAQLDAGVPLNWQAARGHVLTPEHGKSGAAPKLAEKAENYKNVAKRAKEARLTGEATSRPSQRVTAALEGERRPHIHLRERDEGFLTYPGEGAVYFRNTANGVYEVLDDAGDHDQRVTMQAFDCTRKKWYPVFRNPQSRDGRKHSPGIDAGYLREWHKEHGGSFEQFIMGIINNDGSNYKLGKIGHICQYQVVVLPRETAAERRAQERHAQSQLRGIIEKMNRRGKSQ